LGREWRRLYHGEPPRISRDLLVLALGYRLQEIEHSGFGKATRRKLQHFSRLSRISSPDCPAQAFPMPANSYGVL
jgi:hypothetical protein